MDKFVDEMGKFLSHSYKVDKVSFFLEMMGFFSLATGAAALSWFADSSILFIISTCLLGSVFYMIASYRRKLLFIFAINVVFVITHSIGVFRIVIL